MLPASIPDRLFLISYLVGSFDLVIGSLLIFVCSIWIGFVYNVSTGIGFFFLLLGYFLAEFVSGLLLFGPFLYPKYAPEAIHSSLQWVHVDPDRVLFSLANMPVTLEQGVYWHGYVVVWIVAVVTVLGVVAWLAGKFKPTGK
jgi:hypothetical protein